MESGSDELPMDAIQRPLSDIRGQGSALLTPTDYAAEAVAASAVRSRSVRPERLCDVAAARY